MQEIKTMNPRAIWLSIKAILIAYALLILIPPIDLDGIMIATLILLFHTSLFMAGLIVYGTAILILLLFSLPLLLKLL